MSSENIFDSFKKSGISLFAIFKAKPSAIAVFPTPGSPTRSGLFFFLLPKISMTLSNSLSLPITGSIFDFFAILTSSLEFCSKIFSFLSFCSSFCSKFSSSIL